MDGGILPVLLNNFVTTRLLAKDIKVPHAGQMYTQPDLTLLNYDIIILIIITLDLILAC